MNDYNNRNEIYYNNNAKNYKSISSEIDIKSPRH